MPLVFSHFKFFDFVYPKYLKYNVSARTPNGLNVSFSFEIKQNFSVMMKWTDAKSFSCCVC